MAEGNDIGLLLGDMLGLLDGSPLESKLGILDGNEEIINDGLLLGSLLGFTDEL